MSSGLIYFADMPKLGKESIEEMLAPVRLVPGGAFLSKFIPGKLYRVTVKNLAMKTTGIASDGKLEGNTYYKSDIYLPQKSTILFLDYVPVWKADPIALRPYLFYNHGLKFLGPGDRIFYYLFYPDNTNKVWHYFIENTCYTDARKQKRLERLSARTTGEKYQQILDARARGEIWAMSKIEKCQKFEELSKAVQDAGRQVYQAAGMHPLTTQSKLAYEKLEEARKNLENFKQNNRLKKL
ncbi:MAG: hypothetical protein WC761_02285 [Candidatus Paceibacterota bacterium]